MSHLSYREVNQNLSFKLSTCTLYTNKEEETDNELVHAIWMHRRQPLLELP